jgi:hypothetical protein
MTSYQRLKDKNVELQKMVNRLLTDPEYYVSIRFRLKLRDEAERVAMFGTEETDKKKIVDVQTIMPPY